MSSEQPPAEKDRQPPPERHGEDTRGGNPDVGLEAGGFDLTRGISKGLPVLTEGERKHLDSMAKADKWRGRIALGAGLLAATAPIAAFWWIVCSGLDTLSLERVVLAVASLGFSAVFLRFADRMGIPLHIRERMERQQGRDPNDLVDALKTVADAVRGVVKKD